MKTLQEKLERITELSKLLEDLQSDIVDIEKNPDPWFKVSIGSYTTALSEGEEGDLRILANCLIRGVVEIKKREIKNIIAELKTLGVE